MARSLEGDDGQVSSSSLHVDDSGRWGRGGLFTALEVRSDEPRKQYELAGKMKGIVLTASTRHLHLHVKVRFFNPATQLDHLDVKISLVHLEQLQSEELSV